MWQRLPEFDKQWANFREVGKCGRGAALASDAERGALRQQRHGLVREVPAPGEARGLEPPAAGEVRDRLPGRWHSTAAG